MENLLLLFDYETHFFCESNQKIRKQNHSFNNYSIYQYGRKEKSTC